MTVIFNIFSTVELYFEFIKRGDCSSYFTATGSIDVATELVSENLTMTDNLSDADTLLVR